MQNYPMRCYWECLFHESIYLSQHHNSESSSEDAQLHYTAKIGVEASKGPGGIGSYLARQEFGSNEGQTQTSGNQDSGYVSHGSAGGYPKMQLPVFIETYLAHSL